MWGFEEEAESGMVGGWSGGSLGAHSGAVARVWRPQSPFKVEPVPAARGAYFLSEIESCGFRSGVFAGGEVIHGLVE